MKNWIFYILISLLTQVLFAQKNFIDQPYIETNVKADTLVIPDKIYLSIQLNEADSKNKKSVEEQEKVLENTLRKLQIDLKNDLSLLDFSSNFKNYFLKGQNVIKSKMYSLLIRDAMTAGNVMSELEKVGISNVQIERTEYSKADEIIALLKAKAVKKSKKSAENLAQALDQKIGKAIYISDINTVANSLQGQAPGLMIRGMASLYGSRNEQMAYVEFKKVAFDVQVTAKYILMLD